MSAQKLVPCYLCRLPCDPHRYRDHIPPKGVFPSPLPSNLLTVPCCEPCNHKNHSNDELFRTITCLGVNPSRTGDAVFKKALKRSVKSGRIKSEFDGFLKSFQRIILPDATMAAKSHLSARPLRRQVIRLTKGLLYIFHPELDYSSYEWHVILLNQFNLHTTIGECVPFLIADERGNGAYKFWRGLPEDNPNTGLWIHCFHDRVAFAVIHKFRGNGYRPNSGVYLKI